VFIVVSLLLAFPSDLSSIFRNVLVYVHSYSFRNHKKHKEAIKHFQPAAHKMRNAYSILLGKPEGRRPLGKPRRRWVDNIKIDLRDIGWDGVDWVDLAQDRGQWRAFVNTAMNLWVP
jgi:hypothetical protein